MIDFSAYQPPGVYIEETISSVVNVAGVRPAVIGLIGPAVGYRLETESHSFTNEDPVPLRHEGIDTGSITVSSLSGVVFENTSDYVISTDGNVTLIAWESGGNIGAGVTVVVTYEYTDSSYHLPLRFTDFDDVQDAYGPPLDMNTGEIVSPLSFAAMIAFQNGARTVVAVATTGGATSPVDPSHLVTAYGKIAAIQDVNLVVPLPLGVGNANIGTVIGGLAQHCAETAQDGYYRLGIIGPDRTVTTDPDSLSGMAGDQRVILSWPNALNYWHGYTNQTIVVDGFYLAAAYAGRLVSILSHVPLTRKRIYGFSGFPADVASTMTKSNKDQWSQAGVCVAEINRQGQLVVRHGVTTSLANIQSREINLVRARDALVNLLQETMDSSDLIGSFITADTPGRVKGIVAGVLEQAINTGTIVNYRGLKARTLNANPSVIEVKFQYIPAYPLNYIVISFSIDTSNSEVAIIDQPTGP